MKKINSILALTLLVAVIASCSKDKEPNITIPASDGSTLTLEGKTAESNYANVVYADLSTNKIAKSDRKSWALGFYSGSDFRVVLNPSFQVLTSVVNKTDINTVTLDDAKATLVYNYGMASFSDVNAYKLADGYNGKLSETAIASVSATISDNKVYIIGVNGAYTEPNLYKIKVDRNGTNGYTLQYAKVGDASAKSVTVAKNTDYNFTLVSLGNNNDGATINAEPKKTDWDLSWSYSTYQSTAGNYQSAPYFYQDFVTTNTLGGTKAAEVTAKKYADFSEADLATVTFSDNRDVIGSNWRVTTGTGIKADRFYVIKDNANNVYKLKFVSMGVGNDGGERGKPVIEYKLVKKG